MSNIRIRDWHFKWQFLLKLHSVSNLLFTKSKYFHHKTALCLYFLFDVLSLILNICRQRYFEFALSQNQSWYTSNDISTCQILSFFKSHNLENLKKYDYGAPLTSVSTPVQYPEELCRYWTIWPLVIYVEHKCTVPVQEVCTYVFYAATQSKGVEVKAMDG